MSEIQNGTYLGRVVSYGVYGLESEDQKPHVAIEFEFYELEGLPRLTWYGYLHTEKIFPITMKALRALGFAGNDISNLHSLDGAEASLVVEKEFYDGKERTRIKWVNSPEGRATLAPADPAAVKRFAATMREKIALFDAANGKPKVNGKPEPKKKAAPSGDTPPF